jgi:hypothetical protein
VPFGFASESAQRRAWYFRLLNEGGEQVWESESQPEAAAAGETAGVTLMLRPGRSISRTMVVPMVLPDGRPLAAGRYLLEAVLLSDMPLTASTVILVQGTDTPPGPDTRLGVIQGRAVQAQRDENSIMPPAPGYRVSIIPVAVLPGPGPVSLTDSSVSGAGFAARQPPIRVPLPIWTGVTGQNGEFRAEVPPGEYEVRVEFAGAVIMIYPPPPLWRGSERVRVAAGQTTETTVLLTLQHADGVNPGVRPPVLSRFPAHWGPPPAMQTMDIVELPGGYGMGSSTLKHWIQGNLDRDAGVSGSGGTSNAVLEP